MSGHILETRQNQLLAVFQSKPLVLTQFQTPEKKFESLLKLRQYRVSFILVNQTTSRAFRLVLSPAEKPKQDWYQGLGTCDQVTAVLKQLQHKSNPLPGSGDDDTLFCLLGNRGSGCPHSPKIQSKK
jgi:hypothetical protein